MKCFKLTASILVVSLLSSTAFAKAVMKGESLPASIYSWTGFYVGANGGIVNHTMNITDTQGTSFLSTLQQVSNPSMTGGLQAGYRRQIDFANTSGVYGLELSANISNASFDKQYGAPFATYQLNFQHKLKDVALLEATGGIAADRTLFFLAAGLSWININGSVTNEDTIAFFNSINLNKKVFGTALGGGLEYAFDNKLSLRFKVDLVTPNTYSAYDNIGDSFHIANNIVQAVLGLNYKFA